MRVLHCLSQRPSLTGSGITLDALVRHAAAAGWEQRVAAGAPFGCPHPKVGGLSGDRIHPLLFGGGDLSFPVPGMSDVMPYPSTVFNSMNERQIDAYVNAWRRHLAPLVDEFAPDVIHSHHVWLMSSLLKDLAPEIPVVTHCHATGLRQMRLVPRLATRVREGCSRNDAFAVIQRSHVRELAEALAVPDHRIHVVGAGFRDDLFHSGGRPSAVSPSLLYIGKYSAAKGLPQLLDAFERLATSRPGLELHVAGDGSGPQAEALRRRMIAMAPGVVLHGQVGQPELAEFMRRSTVCVLPSFYEGLPLVLVEALACGCRLVATALPGVVDELAPRLGAALDLVELPAMAGVDTPVEAELPAFVDRLSAAIDGALDAPPPGDLTATLRNFTWEAVFERVETVWRRVGVGV
ncbi:MAG: glycosyltransferase family 4 protein [Thermoanaerobaculales bacterium]|jgi:glycosyltransferase involved in cell wall biosynthesis|nr:glycosyltransferase family 4 protein [Thermoanaerobaculales bacterium]